MVPPEGAAAQLNRDTRSGIVAAPDDTAAICAALRELHTRRLYGDGDNSLNPEGKDRVPRERRVAELAYILQSLTY